MKECYKRGCDVRIDDTVYHECCHEDKEMFIFCENAIKANKCPGKE